jgi:2Fe-2S ferredoxin
MATIVFTFEDKSIAQPLRFEKIPPDQSILEIAEDHDIHLNHNCGGVCACSTCHVYVHEGEKYLEEISDKEEDFIDRAIKPKLNSRLACQCIVLSEDAIIEVEIPDQSRIIGHEH